MFKQVIIISTETLDFGTFVFSTYTFSLAGDISVSTPSEGRKHGRVRFMILL